MYPQNAVASSSKVLLSDSLITEAQREEYDVLEAIYPDFIVNDKKDSSLTFEIPVELDVPRLCHVSNPEGETATVSVSSLPPIHLHVSLPSSYPTRPPEIVSIRGLDDWVESATLLSRLIDLWVEGDPVLYAWVELIHHGEFLADLESIPVSHPKPAALAAKLAAYDSSSKETEFSKNAYTCAVCFDSFKGSKCLQLACAHVFCRPCLEDFWGLCIKEGDVGRVGCPDPECTGKEAEEQDVARIVTASELERWKWLRRKRLMERDPTIVHCPRCQDHVPPPADIDLETGWYKFRQCPSCFFSFCVLCKFSWHNPVNPCRIEHGEELVTQYLAEEEGSPRRLALERQYGHQNIARLVARYEDDQSSREWIASSTTVCPGCKTPVQKSMGCNHMTCWKCQHHFCYRCGDKLSQDNPYQHFSDKHISTCYGKLFDHDATNDPPVW